MVAGMSERPNRTSGRGTAWVIAQAPVLLAAILLPVLWRPTAFNEFVPRWVAVASITQDRLEDVLNTRASAIPGIRVERVAWPGGVAGLIEVIPDTAALPYSITQDLTDKIKKGDVFVRHGSHVAKADADELAELVTEARRAGASD
jgi:hypothetical protein